MRVKAARIALFVIISNSFANPSFASDPSRPTVRFDIPAAIACREIPTKITKPQKKTVEAAIPLSARADHPADKFQSMRVELVTFERTPVIRDFMPKETLVAATNGGVAITESEDGRVSYGYVTLQAGKSGASIVAEADTNGHSIQRTYTLPTQKIVVATSGTLDRDSGIWFKFERTAEHQLEKQHMLYVIFEVDQNWRCDALACAVQGAAKDGEVCGNSFFYLGLYLDGDSEAKDRASNLGLNKKYERIVDGRRKVRDIEGYTTYPLFGYGSKAEQERVKVRSLEKELNSELAALRQFKIKLD